MVNVCVIGSSSTGNCTAVWNDGAVFLIDCGLPVKRTVSTLEELGIDEGEITACLVSHAHGDHVNNAMFNHFVKTRTPVYMARSTMFEIIGKYKGLRALRDEGLVDSFTNDALGSAQSVQGMAVIPFMVKHDSPGGCFGYRVNLGMRKVAIATDFGIPQPKVVNNFLDSDCVVLECNYDPIMLEDSPREEELKERIRRTHCSNKEIANVLVDIVAGSKKTRPRAIMLTHISPQCNEPSKAKATVARALRDYGAGDIKVRCAYKDDRSAIIEIGGNDA
jgi:phosphoribosyl 1,2-cyclic phosphodiesterase